MPGRPCYDADMGGIAAQKEELKMKSAVFYGKHDLRVEERPVPQPGRGEVLLRVMACGVCGTDVHIFEGDQGAADCPSGTVLGHEFSGVVEAVGEGVSAFAPGDRVCVDPNRLCGECRPCRDGLGHFCKHMTGIGTTVDGGFAQFCAVPQSQLYRIADGLSFAQAAMAEPVSCCLHGIDLCELRPGCRAAVIGGGMIGLLMVQLLRLSGASFIALLEPVEQKRALGLRLGADAAFDPLREEPDRILRAAGRLDTVIECAGLPSTVSQAVAIAGRRAVVMLFGLTRPDDAVPVRPFDLFRRELTIKASYINPYTMGRAVDLLNGGRLDVSSMLAEEIPLARLPEVLAAPALRAKGKYIVLPQA